VKFLIALTYVLPHRLLCWLARQLAYSRNPRLKHWLIIRAIRHFGADLSEAAEPDPRTYPSFNAFFTRALKPGARTPDPDSSALLIPADGRISQCGRITDGRIVQAKGHAFTVAELLADPRAAQAYNDGFYTTIYLPPGDYHRVHMPCDGHLRETVHIPGRLFSVAPASVRHIPRVFARNERLACHFDTDFGPLAVIMVGALLVSGIETVWSGTEIPAYGHAIRRKDWREHNIHLPRFAEMARFNYGSTVIVLLPPGVARLAEALGTDKRVKVGQALARRRDAD